MAALAAGLFGLITIGSELAQFTGFSVKDLIGIVARQHSTSPVPAVTATPPSISTPPASPGSSSRLLPVGPHLMWNRNWADPAVLQTWLGYDHAGNLPASDADAQQELWGYEGSHNGGYSPDQWDYSPYAVASTFNGIGRKVSVGDAPFASIESAGVAIVNSVYARREPVIALIDGAGTWVLVVGVTLGPGGLSAPPASVTLDDPWPVSKWGEVRSEGHKALGLDVQLTWPEFLTHFTQVPASLPGVWSSRWVLIAAGLALTG